MPASAQEAKKPRPPPTALDVRPVPWRGDFDQMLERRVIRVVVPYSRSLFYNDRGMQRGLTADALEEFERWLNKNQGTGARALTLQIFPVARDELLRRVVSGQADIAAGNLTITRTRDRTVDFSVPTAEGVSEIVMTHRSVPALASLEDLAGRTIHVRPASSAAESLQQLDRRLRVAGKPPLDLVQVPDVLEDEDLLDMLNANLVQIVVVDDWKAKLWGPALRRTRTYPELVVRTESSIGWALREDAPQLKRVVNEFLSEPGRGTQAARRNLAMYERRWRALGNPTLQADWRKFEQSIAIFRKYGRRYHFDPLMLAAQAYQESRLDHTAVSPAGAIGVMQIMPATGEAMKVGDIAELDTNVHAGTKYMRQILDRHFREAKFSEQDRNLFAFASYNAGPGRIAQMRGIAAREGLDPDQWFNNVEIVTAARVGAEPVRYVRNIYKYYTAYRLQTDLAARRAAANKELRQELAPPPKK